MNGFIKMFKTVSRSGKPMFSSIARRETPIGVAFQGSAKGVEQAEPWFIMITEVHPDTLDDIMWYNPTTEELIEDDEYQSRTKSEPTVDSVDESTGADA